MKKYRLHLLSMATVAAIAFPAVTSAAHVAASGTWDDCNFAPEFRTAGPNLVITVGITQNFFGTLQGTYSGTERDVVKGDNSATIHGRGIFTGTVAGRSGSATFSYVGVAPVTPFPDGWIFEVVWVLEGKTGSLESVRGHGTYGGVFDENPTSGPCDAGNFKGSYKGTLNVEP